MFISANKIVVILILFLNTATGEEVNLPLSEILTASRPVLTANLLSLPKNFQSPDVNAGEGFDVLLSREGTVVAHAANKRNRYAFLYKELLTVLLNKDSFQNLVATAGFRPEWVVIFNLEEKPHAIIMISLACNSVRAWNRAADVDGVKNNDKWEYKGNMYLTLNACDRLKSLYFDFFLSE